MHWKTNPSPDSHNSTPSHQPRNPFTGLTLIPLGCEANTRPESQLNLLTLSIIARAMSVALVSGLPVPGSAGRRAPENTTSTSTRQFNRTPTARDWGVGCRAGMLGSVAVAVFVAATTESATWISPITVVVLIGPVCSVVVLPAHCCHCGGNFANSSRACAAEGSATTPSITLITWAGSPSFPQDSDATVWTSADP